MNNIWLIIVLMAVITFCSRYAFFSSVIDFELHRSVKRLLSYAGPTVLTAMWVPIVFTHEGKLSAIDSPYLIAGVFTVILSLVTKKTLLVLLCGIGLFGILNYL